jgi:hypothetical protein
MALVGNLVSYLRTRLETESVTPDTVFHFNSKDKMTEILLNLRRLRTSKTVSLLTILVPTQASGHGHKRCLSECASSCWRPANSEGETYENFKFVSLLGYQVLYHFCTE